MGVRSKINQNKKERKVLLTIDDGLLSFYQNAWPILRDKEIPFILFINTREVGAFNYMNWDQILELHKNENVEIGNHSHSHEYLVEENKEVIKNDIKIDLINVGSGEEVSIIELAEKINDIFENKKDYLTFLV